jgi:hypothetical protein
MAITKIMTGRLSAASLLFITSFAASNAYAGVLIPDITDPSLPQFVQSVKINANNGSWSASANNGLKDFTFNDGTNPIWNGDGYKFNFSAQFDKKTGDFIDGSMSIQGAIPGLGITDKKTVLMSADLTSFGWAGNYVGFNTANIFCDAGLGVPCTPAESIIFTLDSIFSGDPTARLHTTALAVTSVPLPAAVWLFGSGLGLLGGGLGIKRRKALAVR